MQKGTTQYTSTNTIIKFEDMVKAVQQVTTEPINQISVGVKFYENLLKYADKCLKDINSRDNIYISDLYGIKILVDPELKPNEYRVTTEDGRKIFQVLENETKNNPRTME